MSTVRQISGSSYRWNSAIHFGYAPVGQYQSMPSSLHLSQYGVNYNMQVLLNNSRGGLYSTVHLI
ncbi:hypothetical protein HH800_08715 [Sphingobium yanoikuyae]|uniref:Uncharacterized protein n=1 Tax=Sphingobium yanoikuyae TaxID=13690 RepID=A0A6M4G4M2_SPHYA|nr:hypothetical protein [Sphingobium yanoikuyae]QJR02262.1 hypothetical protein HH800_08715 [Sphingobium yanoikuyae]